MKFIFGKNKKMPKDSEGETVMKNTFASKLKELRRERGMGQEQLASVCGVSVQAVSKWECEQSYPDIELLATIADTFNVTIDSLLREDVDVNASADKESAETEQSVEDRLLAVVAERFGVSKEDIGRVDVHMTTGDETVSLGADADGTSTAVFYNEDLPDDGILRVVQYLGRRCLSTETYDRNKKIPLVLSGANGGGVECNIEIWGSADLTLSDNSGIGVCITAGLDVDVKGESVNGNVAAGGSVHVVNGSINGSVASVANVLTRGGGVNGPVNAGGSVSVEAEISGSVSAVGDVNCGEINGSVSAGGNVDCGEIGGSVSAGGNIDCGEIGGDVSAGGDVDCGDVGGDVSAGGDVDCGEIGGDVSAGGDVDCGDVDGDVNAEGDVSCGDVGGDVNAGGDVSCGDVDGDVTAGGSGEFGTVGGAGREDRKKKKSDAMNIDLSNLGEYVSRTVNEAMEAAFGKPKNKDDN